MSRQIPEARKRGIITAAITVAEAQGPIKFDKSLVADAAGCSRSLISHYFGSTEDLWALVMEEAVVTRNLPLIGQGLGVCDPVALAAPQKLKLEAAQLMVGA